MQLLMVIKLAVSLVLILGTSSVASQYDVGLCVNSMTSQLEAGMDECQVIRNGIKCIVKETSLQNLGLSASQLEDMKTSMKTQFAQAGLPSCDFDLAAIMEEVRKEELEGNETTRKPPTFDTALTIGDCISALTKEGIKEGQLTCNQARDFTKCALRVLKFVESNPTSESIREFEITVSSELRKQGLNCNLNVQGLVDEIKNGNTGVTSSPLHAVFTITATVLSIFVAQILL